MTMRSPTLMSAAPAFTLPRRIFVVSASMKTVTLPSLASTSTCFSLTDFTVPITV
jgi:hypothetical protein